MRCKIAVRDAGMINACCQLCNAGKLTTSKPSSEDRNDDIALLEVGMVAYLRLLPTFGVQIQTTLVALLKKNKINMVCQTLSRGRAQPAVHRTFCVG